MEKIKIPFYKSTVDLNVEEKNLKAIIMPKMHEFKTDKSEVELITEALEHPIGTKTLEELAVGKDRVTIITSDHTRSLRSKISLPIMLKKIRTGNKDAKITILIATGLHRPTTMEELRDKLGSEVVDNEHVVINMAFEEDDFEFIGVLPSGAEFYINKYAAPKNCDLLITEGFVEPHFFAGFSGGRKSILPGVCNAATVNENHSYKAIASPYAKNGVLKHNPIHEDMVKAARMVNTQFTLQYALNAEKHAIQAWAGDIEEAHEAGVAFIREWSQCDAIQGDIVVTSNGGYPLDQNLYQSPKSVSTAEACAGDDGVIILSCGCYDGNDYDGTEGNEPKLSKEEIDAQRLGGTNFAKLIQMGTPEEIDAYLSKIPPKETIAEQWCPQIYSRILRKHTVILVTPYMDPEVTKRCNMVPAKTMDEAMEIAYGIKGKDASVVVIPDGVSVMAVKE